MANSTYLKRSVLVSVSRAPALFTQPSSSSSISPLRSFHQLNGPLQEQYSVSFGPAIDKLLKPRRKITQGSTTQTSSPRTKKSRKASSVESSLAALLDEHASQRASRSGFEDSSPNGNMAEAVVGSASESNARQSLRQSESQYHEDGEPALELSGDAYEAISQPSPTSQSSISLAEPIYRLKKDKKGTKQTNASQISHAYEKTESAVKTVTGDVPVERQARKKLEPWQEQKNALTKKFGDEGWNPRKKLSPDAIEGIRSLHEEDPERYTTPILSQHFKVSPEAIRRILKSKWRATPEKLEERRVRWARRYDRIWDQKAALGLRPPRTRDKEPEGPDAFEEEVRAKQLLGQL